MGIRPDVESKRLSAILFADIAGYTKLMEADESGTYMAWKSAREGIIEPAAEEYNGRIIDYLGDGFLAEFTSAEAALSCAIAIQQEFQSHAVLKLRMGLHLGEVFAEGDDIYGESVNLASRLEGFAEEGGICISDPVHKIVEKNLPVEFTDLGEQRFKHVAKAVKVWNVVVPERAPGAGLTEPRAKKREKPSIAVLPFDNMSGDVEQEYFADGLVEDITTELSRVRWLNVVARNSAFTFKGKKFDIRDVGRELNVTYALEGSVRKLGPTVRITAQLLSTENGTHQWADKFDGAIEKIFDILDDVTLSVVGAIEPSLQQAEISRAKRERPENLDAFDLYLQALAQSYKYSAEGRLAARPLLDQALEHDPGYIEAHGLTTKLAMQSYVWEGRRPEDKEATLTSARFIRDSGTDDSTALVRAAWSFASVGENRDTAIELVERALTANPNSAEACTWGAFVHLTKRNCERALALVEKAMLLSPLDPQRNVTLHALATANLYLGEAEVALEAANRALSINPSYLPAYTVQIPALVRLDRLEEAREAYQAYAKAGPQLNAKQFAETFDFVANIDEIVDAMRVVGLPD